MDNANLHIFKIWAPGDSIWSPWAKPVLFFHAIETYFSANEISQPYELQQVPTIHENTMIIADLPGKTGVAEGLALAKLGYRPVPLYNGVFLPSEYSAAVDVTEIVSSLRLGAAVLPACPIRSDAPPVFLLDSMRMSGSKKKEGTYDNRWCIFPQDMPSAAFLLDRGIRKVQLRSFSIQDDLAHILYRYQERGLQIALCHGNYIEQNVKVTKPNRYKELLYRIKVTSGLTRNATGGFGGIIPLSIESEGGSGYYGRIG